MSLIDIKNRSQGFTIVELLIVVVVIAILAAITIVSYNGITNRANTSAAKSTASTFQKKIELYQAEKGAYPHESDLLSANSADSFYVEDTSLINTAPTNLNGTNRVMIKPCGHATAVTAANATGAQITYYNFETGNTETTIAGDCAIVSTQNFISS